MSTRVALIFGGQSSEHGISCLTAASVLDAFRWGPHFLVLNREPLDEYAAAKDSTEVVAAQARYL